MAGPIADARPIPGTASAAAAANTPAVPPSTPPATARERIAREADFDPDLWVVELDLRADDPGLEVV